MKIWIVPIDIPADDYSGAEYLMPARFCSTKEEALRLFNEDKARGQELKRLQATHYKDYLREQAEWRKANPDVWDAWQRPFDTRSKSENLAIQHRIEEENRRAQDQRRAEQAVGYRGYLKPVEVEVDSDTEWVYE